MDAIEKISKARDLLKQGWVQGAFARLDDDGNVRYCAIGALRAACGIDDLNGVPGSLDEKYETTNLMVTVTETGGLISLASYNDRPSRTQDDVVALFDATIERLEGLRSKISNLLDKTPARPKADA